MNKILRFFLVALMTIVFGNVYADEATIKYTGGTTTNMTGENDAALVGLDASAWSVVGDKGKQTNFPGLIYNANGNQIRLYWNAEGSNTITVSSLAGATINSIKITFATGNEGYKNISVTVGGNAVSGTDGAYDINSTSFVLGNANSSNVQVRFTELVINYTPAGGGGSEGGGSGEGGNKETWTACEGATTTLKAAFASVVNTEGVATNETNGRSVVKVDNTALIFKAVGGAVPKDITPKLSVVVNEELHLFGIESISGWNDIKWTNGNNFGDDPENPMYFVNGTGNPFAKMCAEEIYDKGKQKDPREFRAHYFYYEKDGSKGLPYTGLYYKFTPKASGKLKVGIWANKGDRKTYVVKESTKQAIDYHMEGYQNNQKYTAEDAPSEALVGKMKKLTHEQLVEIHNAYVQDKKNEYKNKKKEDGETPYYTEEELAVLYAEVDATQEYVIGHGGNAFRGYITIDVEKGEGYYFFLHSAQMGFCSYELTYEGDVDATVQEKDELAGLGDAKAIENIDISTGIEAITTKTDAINSNAQMYNLSGQKVDKSYKGIVIQNGRKFMNK